MMIIPASPGFTQQGWTLLLPTTLGFMYFFIGASFCLLPVPPRSGERPGG